MSECGTATSVRRQRSWTFQSRSDPRVEWHVTLDDGKPVCDCKGHEEHGHCWHTKTVRQELLETCPSCGGRTYTDNQALRAVRGALLGGGDLKTPTAVIACSACEWAQEAP